MGSAARAVRESGVRLSIVDVLSARAQAHNVLRYFGYYAGGSGPLSATVGFLVKAGRCNLGALSLSSLSFFLSFSHTLTLSLAVVVG